MTATATTTSRAPRWVRLAIWVLAGVFLFTAAATADALTGGTPEILDVAQSPRPAQVSSTSADAAASAIAARYRGNDALNLLPAYRWDNVGLSVVDDRQGGINPLDHAGTEAQNLADRMFSFFSSLMFSIQAWMWGILIHLLAFAFDFSLLTNNNSVTRINDGFVKVADGIFSSGLWILPLLAGAIWAARAALAGNTTRVARLLMAGVLPVAALWALTAQASDAGDNADAARRTGPIGLANLATTNIEQLTRAFGSGFDQLDQSGLGMAPAADTTIGCKPYMDALYSSYFHARGDAGAGAEMLPNVSRLWERAFLNNWRQAQFSNTNGSWKVFCHLAEANKGIDRAEQVSLGILAGYPSVDTGSDGQLQNTVRLSDVHDDFGWPSFGTEVVEDQTGVSLYNCDNPATPCDPTQLTRSGMWAPGQMALNSNGQPRQTPPDQIPAYFYENAAGRRDPYSAVDRPTGSRDWQASLLMWAACNVEGRSSDAITAAERWTIAGEVDGHHCRVWWFTGLNPGEGKGDPVKLDGYDRYKDPGNPKLVWDKSPTIWSGISSTANDSATGKNMQVAAYNAATDDDANDVAAIVGSMRGNNSSERLMLGLVSLITTLAYVYLLGLLAVGALFAKLAFALLIILLPITLLAMAFTSKDGTAGAAGRRLMRLTLSMLVASTVFATLLTFMVFLTDTIETLIGTSHGGGVIGMLVPVVAMAVLYFLAKTAGVANIFHPVSLMAAPMTFGMATANSDRKGGFTKAASKFDRNARKSKAAELAGAGAGAAGGAAGLLAKMGKDKVVESYRDRKAAKDAAAGASGVDPDAVTDPATGLPLAATGSAAAGAAAAAAAATIINLHVAPGGAGIVTSTRDTLAGLAGVAAHAGAAVTPRGDDLAGKVAPGDTPALTPGEELDLRKRQLDSEQRFTGDARDRADARKAHMSDQMDLLRESQAQMRDKNGNPMFTPGGEPIFGFSRQREDGTWEPVSAGDARWDARTGTCLTEGVIPVTDPIKFRSSAEVEAIGAEIAGRLGVDAGQLLVSASGMSTLVNPQTLSADGVRLVEAATLEATAQIATHPMHYTSDVVKEQISNSGLSLDGQNWVWHALSIQQGWTDPRTGATVDLPATLNVDLSSSAGLDELSKHLAGQPSKLDQVHAHVNGAELASLIAVAQSRDTEHTSIVRTHTAEYVEAASDRLRRDAEQTVSAVAAHPAVVTITEAARQQRAWREAVAQTENLSREIHAADVELAAATQAFEAGDDTAFRKLVAKRDQLEELQLLMAETRDRQNQLASELSSLDRDQVSAAVEAFASDPDLAAAVDQLAELTASLNATADVADSLHTSGTEELVAAVADATAQLDSHAAMSAKLRSKLESSDDISTAVEELGAAVTDLVNETAHAAHRRPSIVRPLTSARQHVDRRRRRVPDRTAG